MLLAIGHNVTIVGSFVRSIRRDVLATSAHARCASPCAQDRACFVDLENNHTEGQDPGLEYHMHTNAVHIDPNPSLLSTRGCCC
jgi:hypothetical protein